MRFWTGLVRRQGLDNWITTSLYYKKNGSAMGKCINLCLQRHQGDNKNNLNIRTEKQQTGTAHHKNKSV